VGESIPVERIPNGFDPQTKEFYYKPDRKERLTITYAGSFYHGRSPQLILDAVAELDDSVSKDIHIHFIGELSSDQINTIESLNSKSKISIHGRQNREFCMKTLSDSDVCLLMAIGQPNQVPAKVYEYIGLGRPILSISDENDACMRLLDNKDWAWTATAGDKTGLINRLNDIHNCWQNDTMPILDPNGEGNEYGFKNIAGEYADYIRRIITV